MPELPIRTKRPLRRMDSMENLRSVAKNEDHHVVSPENAKHSLQPLPLINRRSLTTPAKPGEQPSSTDHSTRPQMLESKSDCPPGTTESQWTTVRWEVPPPAEYNSRHKSVKSPYPHVPRENIFYEQQHRLHQRSQSLTHPPFSSTHEGDLEPRGHLRSHSIEHPPGYQQFVWSPVGEGASKNRSWFEEDDFDDGDWVKVVKHWAEDAGEKMMEIEKGVWRWAQGR